MEILKEDIFEHLVNAEIFPGSENYYKYVKEAIYDFIGLSEGEAANDIVDVVHKASLQFTHKSAALWKKPKHR